MKAHLRKFALVALAVTISGTAFSTAAISAKRTNFSAHEWSLKRKYKRRVVRFSTNESPGTIIISTRRKFLYLVEENGKALRYGIGVGRRGYTWKGVERITRKSEWPDWRPPAEMLDREPDLPKFMPGGLDNPLGARALYLGNSLYRIHGTAQPWTIGTAISSGCIRLTNDAIIDLYQRTEIGAKVIVE